MLVRSREQLFFTISAYLNRDHLLLRVLTNGRFLWCTEPPSSYYRETSSYIQPIDNDALGPCPLHDSRNLIGTVVVHESTDQIQCCINTGAVSAGSYDAQAAKSHGGSACNGFATRVRALP